MQIAVRSYLTAGVAMMGAAALVAAPISTSPPEIQVPAIYSAQVNLAAAVDPITPWLSVFGDAFSNVVGIGTAVASDPAPALRQLITNSLGYAETVGTGLTGAGEAFITWATENLPMSLESVFANLANGNVTDAAIEVNNLIVSVLLIGFPLFDSLAIPSQIVDSFARVVTTLTSIETVLPLISGVLTPIMSVVTAVGDQGQALVDALGAGDPLSALSAVVNTPATVTGAFLNGYGDYPGLLTFLPEAPGAGLLGALLVAIPKAIAEALAPPVAARFAAQTTATTTADIAAIPEVTATTITLNPPADTAVEAPTTDADQVSNVVGVKEAVTEEPAAVEQTVEEPAAVEQAVDEPTVVETNTEKAPDPRVNIKDEQGAVKQEATTNDSPTPSKTQKRTKTEAPSAVNNPAPSASANDNAGKSRDSGSRDSGSRNSGDE